MRYAIAILAVIGIVVSCLALAAHYGPRANPLDLLSSNWNSAYVNQSPFSEVYGVPVAVLGILGYGLLALLALRRRVVLTVYAAGIGLAYALYLTDVEGHILRVWCVYSVSSLVVMILIVFLAFAAFIYDGGSRRVF
jgi:vitamin-K-epoxide reductase (warfarin-sensitive)